MPKDALLVKLEEYSMLVKTSIRVTVNRSGLECSYTINFQTYGFPHLVGLGKYESLQMLKRYNDKLVPAKAVVKDIEKGRITYEALKKSGLWASKYGEFLKERIDSFSYKQIVQLLNNEIVVYFDKVKLGTDFDADLIIYDQIGGKYYHFSVLHQDKNNPCDLFVASSYFIDQHDTYIKNQNTAMVSLVEVIDKDLNSVVFEKTFTEMTS